MVNARMVGTAEPGHDDRNRRVEPPAHVVQDLADRLLASALEKRRASKGGSTRELRVRTAANAIGHHGVRPARQPLAPAIRHAHGPGRKGHGSEPSSPSANP